MILIVHNEGKLVKHIIVDHEIIEDFSQNSITEVFWELAEKYPTQLIAWCEEKIISNINSEDVWKDIFQNNHVMASFGVNTCFLSEAIGYVDQLPFVNFNRKVQYPTWQMSSDIGGINGGVLLKFRELFNEIDNFDYLLNAIAKLGQQNGLFCYSSPKLIKNKPQNIPLPKANAAQLFKFVYQNYNSIWVTVLLWCFLKYDRKFPIIEYLKAFFNKKKFQISLDLGIIRGNSINNKIEEFSVDVIIPTLGRKKFLEKVLVDLKNQTFFPRKVIIIEQNPEIESNSELENITKEDWPFKIIHYFIHQTGACNARNIAMKEVTSNWIFFADDDIRINPEVLEKSSIEIMKYGFNALNLNCKQLNEITVFPKIKQWGSFGSGTSIVKSSYAKKCKFSMVYEYGYGEDADYGMQLRNVGCDIIYHPHIEILHLKAPIGGFREKPRLPWENEVPLPKPSPTLMSFVHSYYTPNQILGFKTSLFIKFYSKQAVKNPLRYIKLMRKQWKKSEVWAIKLQKMNS